MFTCAVEKEMEAMNNIRDKPTIFFIGIPLNNNKQYISR
jgi:hypothetical protein